MKKRYFVTFENNIIFANWNDVKHARRLEIEKRGYTDTFDNEAFVEGERLSWKWFAASFQKEITEKQWINNTY